MIDLDLQKQKESKFHQERSASLAENNKIRRFQDSTGTMMSGEVHDSCLEEDDTSCIDDLEDVEDPHAKKKLTPPDPKEYQIVDHIPTTTRLFARDGSVVAGIGKRRNEP